MPTIKEINDFLSNFLNSPQFRESAINGLQVGEFRNQVNHIALALDSNLATLKKASEMNADLLIVHHGLFWGKPFAITNSDYEKINLLCQKNLALMAYHLPLDAHPASGNNALLVKKLELTQLSPFFSYHNEFIGIKAKGEDPSHFLSLIQKNFAHIHPSFLKEAKAKLNSPFYVGVITGQCSLDFVNQALEEKLDLIITGEINLPIYNTIIDSPLAILPLGHYDSERLGVKNLENILQKKWPSLKYSFIEDIKPI
jgi:dinuclear metal center YbgI/SA1388 family protein